MSRTLTGLYDSYDDAKITIAELQNSGVKADQISVLANNARGDYNVIASEGNEAGPGAEAGAAFGAITAGGTGLMAGLGMLVIPGIGPVVAGGWLLATAIGLAGGAVVGAAAGGLVGTMVGNGVLDEAANINAEGVRRGGTLVTVRIEDPMVPVAGAILAKHRPVNLAERGREYRVAGWTRFDAAAPPYTPTALPRERVITPAPHTTLAAE